MPKLTKKTLLNILFMIIMTSLFNYCLVIVWNTMELWMAVSLFSLSIIILALGLFCKLRGVDSFYKIAMISIYVGVVLIIFYDILIFSGFLARFENYNELKEFIRSSGGKSELIFILAQFLQVTFIPIPSNIVVLLGDELFGPVKGFFLSLIGLMIGSMFAFFLGKTFGLRLATWIAGKEAIEKYQKIVKGRDKALLVMMFLFPFFPDDLLCLIAGLTSMGYFSFFLVMIIARPLAIGGTILVKHGLFNYIPLSGWGIPVWLLLSALMVYMFYYTVKYGDRIELAMLKFMGKLTSKDYVRQMYPARKGEQPVDKNITDQTRVILYDSNYECKIVNSTFECRIKE